MTLPVTEVLVPVITPPTTDALFTAPVTLKLVPVAAPMFGVVNCAPVLTLMLPEPSNAVVTPSTLALNTDPIKLKPADVLAVYAPAAENCDQVIAVVPIVPVASAVDTQPVSALVEPVSTNVNAPGTSAQTFMSVERVNTVELV